MHAEDIIETLRIGGGNQDKQSSQSYGTVAQGGCIVLAITSTLPVFDVFFVNQFLLKR